jgi:hypothetical protein
MSKPDGGPAFPCEAEVWLSNTEHPRWVTQNVSGMSLRDYFAGQALTGMVLACCIANSPLVGPETAAKGAYEFADAMLAARDKE